MLLLLTLTIIINSIVNSTKKVDLSYSFIDSQFSDIQWLSEGSKTIIALSVGGSLYKSVNGGRKFNDISENVYLQMGIDKKIAYKFVSLHVHPIDKQTIFVMGGSKYHAISSDGGNTWKKFAFQGDLHNFIWHPNKMTHALFSRWTNACYGRKKLPDEYCRHELYYISNFKKPAKLIASGVIQYNWANKNPSDDKIYLTKHSNLTDHQSRFGGWYDTANFDSTNDFGQTFTTHIKGGNKFLITKNFIFVAKLENFQTQTVSLQVSSDYGVTFIKATLPTDMTEKSYTIVDTTEGNVIIHVNHGSSRNQLQGNIYVSDEHGLRYSLSLPNNIRGSSGECEFDRLLSVDGIYVANYMYDSTSNADPTTNLTQLLDADYYQSNSRKLNRKVNLSSTGVSKSGVRTVISFDKGGSWQYLKPPTHDSLGNKIACEHGNGCFLQLNGITQYERYAPFYSTENSTGIIMGTGMVGPVMNYNETMNTFISRDAGKTWHEVHKGNFIYEIGNFGGLVVMAKDGVETNQVVFSWNQGMSWYDFNLTTDSVKIDNIIIEPQGKSLEFILYGTYKGKGIAYHLDFQSLQLPICQGLDRPDATDSDYITWKIHEEPGIEGCTLGRTITYVRRKPERECFNPSNYEQKRHKTVCACTKRNYQCEVGFYREIGHNNDCEPSPYDDRQYMAVEGCTASGVYFTHAYRKIVGDECVGGYVPNKVPVPCPPGSPIDSSAIVSLATVFMILSLIGIVAYASRHPKLKHYIHQTGIDNFVEVGYNMVGRSEVLFNFWTNSPTIENQIEL